MPKQKSDLEQLTGILGQFENTTILSAVDRVVPREELVKLGGAGTGPLVIPPVILYPGGGVAGEAAAKSTDCGPKEVKATEKGKWDATKANARKDAREEVRKAAGEACGSGCPKGQACKYLETSNTLSAPEERQNPDNANQTQYRYESTSEGTCQCE